MRVKAQLLTIGPTAAQRVARTIRCVWLSLSAAVAAAMSLRRRNPSHVNAQCETAQHSGGISRWFVVDVERGRKRERRERRRERKGEGGKN
eukprot:4396298-Pleurochrysis_carterae.AAC.1